VVVNYIGRGISPFKDKANVQNIVRDLQQDQQSGNNTYKEWTQAGYPSINLKGKAT
jgi:hypothetical protein